MAKSREKGGKDYGEGWQSLGRWVARLSSVLLSEILLSMPDMLPEVRLCK